MRIITDNISVFLLKRVDFLIYSLTVSALIAYFLCVFISINIQTNEPMVIANKRRHKRNNIPEGISPAYIIALVHMLDKSKDIINTNLNTVKDLPIVVYDKIHEIIAKVQIITLSIPIVFTNDIFVCIIPHSAKTLIITAAKAITVPHIAIALYLLSPYIRAYNKHGSV